MTFGHPYLLLTLLLVPAAVVAYRLLERRRARYAVRYTNVAVLEQVLVSTRPWRRWLVNGLCLLALATLCVAVTRPHVQRTVVDENATVVLVLDVSGSMHAVDVKPTRLVAAQQALHSFLQRVPKRLKVGLVLFAGEAQVATPPTKDHALVSEAIDNAGYFNGFGGTAIGDALALAVRIGIQSAGIPESSVSALSSSRQLAAYVAAPRPAKSSLVSILFLSDGHQNRGLIAPLDGAERARAAGIPVYTVALGTTGNTHLADGYGFFGGGGPPGGFRGLNSLAPDPRTLGAIAHVTGGEFFRARTSKALQDAYTTLGSKLGKAKGREEVTDLFAFGGAVLLVLAGVAAAFWSPRLP
ncbi:MAG TPA: VWA domain-containing protein [Gaiellaceae bacterium]|nr:VWA domain-containing protein [Gaiellaceae bacterium]